jgi:hypothetical protein
VTQAEYDKVAGDLMALALSIEDGKRPGYTVGSEDVLANFKRAAERAGVSVGQAWTILWLKHVDAVLSIMTRPDLPQAEAPPGRFADCLNYLRLGYAILNEMSPAPSAVPPATSERAVRMPRYGQAYAEMGCTTTQPSVQIVDTNG